MLARPAEGTAGGAGGKLPLWQALLDSDLETVRLELDPDSLEMDLKQGEKLFTPSL